MRPTIDEQLAGVRRLLSLAEADDGISPATHELLRNAQRLVERVSSSWAGAWAFLVEDNAHLAELLGQPPMTDTATTADIAHAAARNEELRGSLAQLIAQLPGDPEGRARRSEIGRYLLRRVAVDPT